LQKDGKDEYVIAHAETCEKWIMVSQNTNAQNTLDTIYIGKIKWLMNLTSENANRPEALL